MPNSLGMLTPIEGKPDHFYHCTLLKHVKFILLSLITHHITQVCSLGEHLGPVMWLLLILIKFVCFVVNIVSVLINVFIVVKIKCMNSGRICDICDKINFTTNYTHFTTLDRHLSKHTQILQILTRLARQSRSGTLFF